MLRDEQSRAIKDGDKETIDSLTSAIRFTTGQLAVISTGSDYQSQPGK
jgi:hypothetical protein